MAESILETQRRMHEEIERLELAIANELTQKTKAHREKVLQDHRVKKHLLRIRNRSQTLLELYQDDDGQRRNEIRTISGGNEFTEFYQRLRDIKEHHRKFPNEVVEALDVEIAAANPEEEEAELEGRFTGEEAFGKYLDLHEQHELFLNLTPAKDEDSEGRRVTYLAYISDFDKFDRIPRTSKSRAAYEKYLGSLRNYLEGWFERAQPLFDLEALKRNAMDVFDSQWTGGVFQGWTAVEGAPSLYCEACQREFAKQSVYDAHLEGKKHIKAAAQLSSSGQGAVTAGGGIKENRAQKDRNMAMNEALIMAYGLELGAIREETKMNVERKQALTDKERLEDVQDIEVEEEEEEAEEQIYNPLKLPLGWDGKPIPYWLYKLHGLGVEYPCEICGNYIYMGRKAFDRHFQESRHANGMRALGIPNSRHFHDITLIEDAYALWEKIKAKSKTEDFRPEMMEEYEDQDGNVFNRKTYEDLLRQGLLG